MVEHDLVEGVTDKDLDLSSSLEAVVGEAISGRMFRSPNLNGRCYRCSVVLCSEIFLLEIDWSTDTNRNRKYNRFGLLETGLS